VSAAGGLGCIGAGSSYSADWVTQQASAASGSGVPFGIGFMGWALARDPAPFHAALAARPALVSVSFADPIDGLGPFVELAAETGAAVAVQVGSVDEAVAAQALGATLVVARGGEAGGHGRNAVATLPLLQAVLDRADVPVLAAGGISGARGLAAVLAAGAAGAWVGTAFAGCTEATSSAPARAAMAAASATDTRYTSVFDIALRIGWPAGIGGRALGNDFTATWGERESLLRSLVAAADTQEDVTITEDMRAARAAADVSMAPVYCGQGVGEIRVDVPAAEIVAEFARADELLRAAAGIAGN
jgi:nitronate monooxygenase